jgi:hypothetical protein
MILKNKIINNFSRLYADEVCTPSTGVYLSRSRVTPCENYCWRVDTCLFYSPNSADTPLIEHLFNHIVFDSSLIDYDTKE